MLVGKVHPIKTVFPIKAKRQKAIALTETRTRPEKKQNCHKQVYAKAKTGFDKFNMLNSIVVPHRHTGHLWKTEHGYQFDFLQNGRRDLFDRFMRRR